MANTFLKYIVSDFRDFGRRIILTENPDGFLVRKDVVQALSDFNIIVVSSNSIEQRKIFELRDKNDASKILIFISENNSQYLEDIQIASAHFEFHLSNYIQGYHVQSIISCDLELLHKLYEEKQIFTLSKRETVAFIKSLGEKKVNFDIGSFKTKIDQLNSSSQKDWHQIIKTVSEAILFTVDTKYLSEVMFATNLFNNIFQGELKLNYKQIINSSAVKKPKIVSKILDHLSFTGLHDKLALIVVDGMSFWQYQMLSRVLPVSTKCKEDFTYSWIPSITQLSRQAIFRGNSPFKDYFQKPDNEEKLWKSFWKEKGLSDYEIRYNFEEINFSNLKRVSKFALVFNDLDEKMHSSTDYSDLKSLTANWIARSNIANIIQVLLDSGFVVYLTTDHGNIPAKGWRRLKGREKLGANKSGSRSQRHIEYSEKWIADEFLESNSEIKDSLVQDDNVIYIKDNRCFSKKKLLITHGGSHLLEVIIPFIKIVK